MYLNARHFCLYYASLLPLSLSILVPLLHSLASSIYRDACLALHRTPFQRFQQLRSCCQRLCCLGIGHPLPSSLVHFWPLRLLLRDCTFPELIACFRSVLRQLRSWSCIRDSAEVLLHLADDASFLPCFTTGSCLCRLVKLPPSFR